MHAYIHKLSWRSRSMDLNLAYICLVLLLFNKVPSLKGV